MERQGDESRATGEHGVILSIVVLVGVLVLSFRLQMSGGSGLDLHKMCCGNVVICAVSGISCEV